MGRAPCCAKVGLHRGPWTTREDTLLTRFIEAHGEGHWRSLPYKAGLLRCGKSCRLRWMNYLRPDIKRGNITPDEDDLIIRMHSLLGNRWSLIAGRLPGRTDNEIKNYWNTHLSKRFKQEGTDPNTHRKSSKPKKVRNNESSNKKRQYKNKSAAMDEEPEKPNVVHLPKPIRVKSSTFLSNTTSGSSSSQQKLEIGDYSFKNDHNHDHDNNNSNNGLGFFIGDDSHDYDLVDGHDLKWRPDIHIPDVGDNTLEKLYEEYLQLLKTDDEKST